MSVCEPLTSEAAEFFAQKVAHRMDGSTKREYKAFRLGQKIRFVSAICE
jgi:hypothetical protein